MTQLETTQAMTEEDVKARVELILRGEAHNEGTPKPYSAWNPTPNVSDLTLIYVSNLTCNQLLTRRVNAEQCIQVLVRPNIFWL